MKNNALTKSYGYLSPRERFKLVLAAGDRGDETEVDRLVKSSPRVNLTMPAHAPHSHAFQEVAQLVFMELAQEAASYREHLLRAEAMGETHRAFSRERPQRTLALARCEQLGERYLDLALAAGRLSSARPRGGNASARN